MKSKWIVATLFAAGAALGGASARAADAQASPDNIALAARLADVAQRQVAVTQPDDSAFHRCAALLGIACRLDPAEIRYPRLLVEARRRLGDTQHFLEALALIRKLRPDDQVAQLDTIRLYAGRIDTVQKKVAYLSELIGRQDVPPEVRSSVAALCALLLRENARDAEAAQMLQTALAQNPLNQEAIRAQFAMLPADAPRDQRVALLLRMVRCDPAQPDVLWAIAGICAQAGLPSESVGWYSTSVQVATLSGTPLSREAALNYAAELMLADQWPNASQVLEVLIRSNPEDAEALQLAVISDRRIGAAGKAALEIHQVQARNVLLNELARARSKLGIAGATTRPVDQGRIFLPELAGDAQSLKAADAPTKQAYLQALKDLAWFDLFHAEDVEEAQKIVGVLLPMADPSDLSVARIEGWLLLRQNKPAEATAKLTAAASDPLAQLGLIRLAASDPAAAAQANEQAARLLARNPAGPVAATIQGKLPENVTARVQGTEDAPAVRAALNRFPREWLDIIQNPRAFYSLAGDPVKITFGYGEPMLVRVTLQNTSAFDLSIGRDGTIKPDLWFNAELQGLRREVFGGVAIEQLTDRLVLKPGQSIVRIVRIDQGQFGRYLLGNPRPAITLRAVVATNMAGPQGPGACGYGVVMPRLMERSANPLTEQAITALATEISEGARDRIGRIELAATYASMLRSAVDQAREASVREANLKFADLLSNAIQVASRDPQPAVRAWAGYARASLLTGSDQFTAVKQMVGSEDWLTRAIGIMAEELLPREQALALLAPMAEKESEPLVREYGLAMLDGLRRAPATQPATTQPAAVPPG